MMVFFFLVWLSSHLREAEVPVWCFPKLPFWPFVLCRPCWMLCFLCFPVPIHAFLPVHLGYPSALLEVLNIAFLLSHLLASNGKISWI